MERHNNTKVEQILRDQNKGVEEIPPTPNGLLSRLFRKFLIEKRVNLPQWHSLLNDFVQNVYAGRIVGRRPNLVSLRGNTVKTLSKTEMTFNNFFDGLKFLGFKRIKIVVIGIDKNGREYVVDEDVVLNVSNNSSLIDEEKESKE